MGLTVENAWVFLQAKNNTKHFQVLMIEDIFIVCNRKWAASWRNQQNGMCGKQRLRSAWASAQSDQSLRYPHEESLGP